VTYIVLVLVSFGLVLLATILLVVGLLTDDGLTLIYLSIAASFTAAVVLYLAFRKARPKADADLQPPAPIAPEGADEEDLAAPPRHEPTAVTPAVTTPETEAVEEPEAEPVLVDAGASPSADDWTADDDWADDGDFDVEFPIADYDDLTVAEIMPLLPQLYSDELGIVAERERTGKNRSTILARLDELAASGTAADALEAESLDAEPEPMPAAAEAAAAVGSRDETLAAPRPTAPVPQVPSLADDEYDDGYVFPIADYDELSVDQIVPLLAQLEDDELEEVKEREATGQGRKTVIAEIDRQLGLVGAVDADDSELDLDGWADERPSAPSLDGRSSPQAETAEGSALAIAGYDGLTVAQIRPLLAGLSDHELRAVLDHEVARDNRSTIVAEIERRLASPEPAAPPATTTTATRATKAPARKAAKKATAKKSATRSTTKKSAAKKSSRTTKKAAAARFPIPDYDELTVAQIRPRLRKLSDDQLRQVRVREESGAGRKTILNDIAGRLD
jgi:hypothetical protein